VIVAAHALMDLFRTRNLQEWINHWYFKEGTAVISLKPFSSIETSDGLKFRVDDQIQELVQVFEQYCFDDIRQNDIVIDIGSNIGGFALRAAMISGTVYTVDPIFNDRLKLNAELNQIHLNIIEGALGESGESQTYSYGENSKNTLQYSLTDIRKIAGGCDFLKCDCEGGEWHINPDELKGIRRLEMELHKVGPKHKKNFRILMDYINENYVVKFDPSAHYALYGTVHAFRK
jgi:hypothetical protein